MKKFHIKPKEEQPNYKTVFPDAKDIINYAFSIDDKDFFEFNDFASVPCDRGFASLSYFAELDMRMTREYLNAHYAAMENILNSKQVKMTDIMKLHMQMKERLDFVFEHNIGYKLCSVVFFDGTENPYRYDYKHALKNAELFQEVPIDAFFLNPPMTKLFGSMTSSIKDFETYSRILTEINNQHISVISGMLSEADKKRDLFRTFRSLAPSDAA